MQLSNKEIIIRNIIIYLLLICPIYMADMFNRTHHERRINFLSEKIQKDWEHGWNASTLEKMYFIENTDKNNVKIDLSKKPKIKNKLFYHLTKKYKVDNRKETNPSPPRIGKVLAYRINNWEIEYYDINNVRGIVDKSSIYTKNYNTKPLSILCYALMFVVLYIITTIQLIKNKKN